MSEKMNIYIYVENTVIMYCIQQNHNVFWKKNVFKIFEILHHRIEN